MNRVPISRVLLLLGHKNVMMNGLILTTDNQDDIRLFVELANKMGMKSRLLSEDELLDMGLLNSIKEGRKSGYASKEDIDQIFNGK